MKKSVAFLNFYFGASNVEFFNSYIAIKYEHILHFLTTQAIAEPCIFTIVKSFRQKFLLLRVKREI